MPPALPLPFFCELCRKGYARISELEVHETSYDHHHRKRAADLRSANQDASRRSRNAGEILGVLGDDDGRGGKKKKMKRGHKEAFAESAKTAAENKRLESQRTAAISDLYGDSPSSSRDSRSPIVANQALTSVPHSTAVAAAAKNKSIKTESPSKVPRQGQSRPVLRVEQRIAPKIEPRDSSEIQYIKTETEYETSQGLRRTAQLDFEIDNLAPYRPPPQPPRR